MLETLRSSLDKYRGFEVSCVYGLFPKDAGEFAEVKSRWPESYPHSDRRGVYLIFGKSGRLLYVGKASQQPIGTRLGSYFHSDGNKGCRIAHPDWSETPAYVVTIAVPDDRWHEASSLEEYLIVALKPCDNSRGLSTAVGAA
jgi:excinuclease UvrABC nuclease subunit